MLSPFSRLLRRDLSIPLFISGIVLALAHAPSVGVSLMALGIIAYMWRGSVGRCMKLGQQALAEFNTYWHAAHTWVVECRALAQTPAWLQLAWYIATMLWILAFFVSAIRSGQAFQQPLTQGLTQFGLFLGMLEWCRRTLILVRWSWPRLVGKLLLGTTAGLLTCLAAAWARHFTFQLTGEDPASFSSFSTFVTILLAPMLWWGFLCTLAVIWSGLELVIRFLSFLASQWAKKPSVSEEGGDTPIDMMVRVLRSVFALGAAAVLSTLTPALNPANSSELRQAATLVLVRLEYWERQTCVSPTPVHAVKLDATRYSIATGAASWTVTLRTVTCPANDR